MIQCLAVMSHSNAPLYIKCFGNHTSESSLKFHYIVHCSLDAVEEKAFAPLAKKTPSSWEGPFLGLLYPTEDYKVYGYITNTNVKFVLVVDGSFIKEDDIRPVFHQLHKAYIEAISNSFYSFDRPITSFAFDMKMLSLAKRSLLT